MTDILLESGTNEVEFLEFTLNGQNYGLNVAKVCQMVRYAPKMLTRVPLCHPYVLGGVNWMNKNVPLIDLRVAFGMAPACSEPKNGILLVVEINNQASAVVIDGVNRIHRLSWTELEPLSPALGEFDVPFIGSVTVEGHDVLLLDLEKILTEINPPTDYDEVLEHANQQKQPDDLPQDSNAFKIMIAEDSYTIRQILIGRLKKEGFHHIEDFDSGQGVLNRLDEINLKVKNEKAQVSDFVNLIISDIEMPRCDGLTLCRKIKGQMHLNLPVILCSSLVNEALARKCQAVGADDYVTKRQAPQLMEMVHVYAEAFQETRPPQEQTPTQNQAA